MLLLALVLFGADPAASDVVGVGGGIAGVGSLAFIGWLMKNHRDERREWRVEAAAERKECDAKIAALQSQIGELWKRLVPEKT